MVTLGDKNLSNYFNKKIVNILLQVQIFLCIFYVETNMIVKEPTLGWGSPPGMMINNSTFHFMTNP